MSGREVLSLLLTGQYTVCPDTGTVKNRYGRVITPFCRKVRENGEGYIFARLYGMFVDKKNPREKIRKVKAASVSHLVWMVQARRTVPRGCEIHHKDKNSANNCWDNLICVFKFDHFKLHANDVEEEVPF